MQKKVNKSHGIGIENRVMERIQKERVVMASYSTLSTKKGLYIFLIGIFSTVSIFFTSLAFERLTIAKIFGSEFILRNFPWFGAALGLSFFVLAFALAEKSKIFYKWGLIKTAILLFFAILLVSYGVHKTELHSQLKNTSLSILYEIEGKPLELVAGHVVELRTDHGFLFQSVWGKKLKVYVSSSAIVTRKISQGDSLFITGTREHEMFVARGILNLSTEK